MSIDFESQVRTARATLEHEVARVPIASAESVRDRADRRRRQRALRRAGAAVVAVALCSVAGRALPIDRLPFTGQVSSQVAEQVAGDGVAADSAGSSGEWGRSATEDFHRARSILLVNDPAKAQTGDDYSYGESFLLALTDDEKSAVAGSLNLSCLVQSAGSPEARLVFSGEPKAAGDFAQAVLAYPSTGAADVALRTVSAALDSCMVEATGGDMAPAGPDPAITGLSRPDVLVRGFESALGEDGSIFVQLVAVHVPGTSTISTFALVPTDPANLSETARLEQVRRLVDQIAERSRQLG